MQYVEPYFGGGSVLFARDPEDESLWLPPHKGVSEVVNDLLGALMNFWRVLQGEDTFYLFHHYIDVTPFSGLTFQQAADKVTEWPWPLGDIGEALRFFILNRMSLAGRGKGFTGITQTRLRGRMNNEVSAWLSCVEGLPAFHARLKRVLILPSSKALDVIEKFDRPGTLFYLDPPYLHETRATTGEYGSYEMTEEDHVALLERLARLKGRFLLSGYRSTLYDRFACSWSWGRRDFDLPNQAAGGKEKRRMVECVWANYPLGEGSA
jgi:DNA adenine methylase